MQGFQDDLKVVILPEIQQKTIRSESRRYSLQGV